MPETAQAYLLYGIAWGAFGLAHSIFASEILKRRLAHVFGRAYRLAYNGFAIISLAVTFWVGFQLFAGTEPLQHSRGLKVLLGATEISGWFLMFLALGQYDLSRFAGTHQIKASNSNSPDDEDETLQTKGLHRYVRHPLYSAVFLILWGAAWTPFGLATAIFGSAYLLVGTYYEERRLLARYGQSYATYRSQVPAFIPWKGRAA